MVPYEITGGPDEFVKVKVRGKEYTPEQISAFILQDLKKTAEDYLGEKVTDAVITVPGVLQRRPAPGDQERRRDRGPEGPARAARADGRGAGVRAGQEEEREDPRLRPRRRHVRRVGPRRRRRRLRSALSINGNTHLGGDDFDEELINYLAEEFRKQEGIDLRKDPMALQRLKEACREGEDRALQRDGDDDQPAVHHRRPERPQAPADDAHADEVRAARSARWSRRRRKPVHRRAEGRQAQARADRRGRARRRLHPRADGAAARQGAVQGQGAQQDASTPTRSSRSAPPSRAASRPATSRTSSSSTPRRCRLGVETLGGVMTRAHPAQHDDPDQQDRDVLHRRRQPERGDDQRAAGRARVRQGQPAARARSTSRASRRRRAACRRSR